jgi:hypothetical protein
MLLMGGASTREFSSAPRSRGSARALRDTFLSLVAVELYPNHVDYYIVVVGGLK